MAGLTTRSRGKPRIGVPAQDRAGAGRIEFTEGPRSGLGQQPAQLLVAGGGLILAGAAPLVDLDGAGPDITRSAQQTEAAVPLSLGQTQPDPGERSWSPR
jgi:hypothetical protein